MRLDSRKREGRTEWEQVRPRRNRGWSRGWVP